MLKQSLDTQIPQILFSSEGVPELSEVDCPFIPPTLADRGSDNPFLGSVGLSYHSQFYTLALNETHSVCYNMYHPPSVLNHSALALTSLFNQPNSLNNIPYAWYNNWGHEVVQLTLKQLIGLGLLTPANYTPPRLIENPRTLSAWLHVTDRCNLRCSYCYLPHNPVDMSMEVGQAAIEAIFRSALAHNYREINLKYAGGEAMLRFPFIVELHRYAQTLAEQPGLTPSGIILSNGTRLTLEIIEVMRFLDLKLMISLDGLGESHDRQRPYAGGQGSSADVLQGIELALAYDFTPDISITISGRNADKLPELMEWILARELPFSLNFYRENSLSASYSDLKLEEEKIIRGMLATFDVIEKNLPRRSLLGSLIDRANLSAPHLRTCSVGDSYQVFDPRGQVSKCQMAMNKPVATAKTSDPLALIRADKLGIQNIPVEEKEGCRDCEWKYWCSGGCPLLTYRATGRYDISSPNCNIYKTLYPEAVRLEGLRLLKYADKVGYTDIPWNRIPEGI
jgi:uncharacterized protein